MNGQRSVLDENLELQAYGRRKILLLDYYIIIYRGCTHDLLTFCNGSVLELTRGYLVALISK